MREYDRLLGELATGISALSTRGVTLLFAAAAKALQPELQSWAAHADVRPGPVLEQALLIAFELVLIGRTESDLGVLLLEIEDATPGEARDSFSSTGAQDCLICADVAIRVHVDRSFAAGPVIEYALEPVLQAASERLFGSSSLGGGPDEAVQEAILLEDKGVVEAIAFVRHTIEQLKSAPEPDRSVVDEVCSRALALRP